MSDINSEELADLINNSAPTRTPSPNWYQSHITRQLDTEETLALRARREESNSPISGMPTSPSTINSPTDRLNMLANVASEPSILCYECIAEIDYEQLRLDRHNMTLEQRINKLENIIETYQNQRASDAELLETQDQLIAYQDRKIRRLVRQGVQDKENYVMEIRAAEEQINAQLSKISELEHSLQMMKNTLGIICRDVDKYYMTKGDK